MSLAATSERQPQVSSFGRPADNGVPACAAVSNEDNTVYASQQQSWLRLSSRCTESRAQEEILDHKIRDRGASSMAAMSILGMLLLDVFFDDAGKLQRRMDRMPSNAASSD